MIKFKASALNVSLNNLNKDFTSTNSIEEQKEEFKEYLIISINIVSQLLFEHNMSLVNVNAEQIIKELDIWKIKNFVWPNVLYANNGGIILLYKAGDEWLRIQRNPNATYLFTYYTDSEISEDKVVEVNRVENVSKIKELVYNISQKVNISNPNWKEQLTDWNDEDAR